MYGGGKGFVVPSTVSSPATKTPGNQCGAFCEALRPPVSQPTKYRPPAQWCGTPWAQHNHRSPAVCNPHLFIKYAELSGDPDTDLGPWLWEGAPLGALHPWRPLRGNMSQLN